MHPRSFVTTNFLLYALWFRKRVKVRNRLRARDIISVRERDD